MVAIGLVPELTAEAANRAALGAGARVMKTYAYLLSGADICEIESSDTDIILLAGGTDGGDTKTILANAEKIAKSSLRIPIIIAGNRTVAEEVALMLHDAGKTIHMTENVLPSLKKLNIDPARALIRSIFMEQIIRGKGFEKAQAFMGNILMPTPAAVMEGATLLSTGTDSESGWGDLMVVDIGGATTDVHSIARGEPTTPGTYQRGIPEPFAKRTVEGDLGLRVSAASLLAAVGAKKIQACCGWPLEDLGKHIEHLTTAVDYLPVSQEDERLETAMAAAAVELAMERHVGRLDRLMTPAGVMVTQTGKDLGKVMHVIGTGGIFAHSPEWLSILRQTKFSMERPDLLKPLDPIMWVDGKYILWAMGLLAQVNPGVAIRLLKDHLVSEV
jgi:uncharacterized protein (TIGR01319 family)